MSIYKDVNDAIDALEVARLKLMTAEADPTTYNDVCFALRCLQDLKVQLQGNAAWRDGHLWELT